LWTTIDKKEDKSDDGSESSGSGSGTEESTSEGTKKEEKTIPVNKPTITKNNLPSLDTLKAQTDSKFIKSLNDLPINVDFPRLFPLVTIMDKNKNVIWEERKIVDNNLAANLMEFLAFLDKSLNLGKEDEIRKRYYDYIPFGAEPTSGEIPTGLKKFLNEVLTDNSLIVSILKCMNQAIIVPAVTIIRLTFMMAKINYFEIRGKWNIIILLNDDKISITNKRWERSEPPKFNFCWDNEFILNKDTYQLIEAKLCISEITYLNEVSDDDKTSLLNILKDLYRPVNI